MEKCNEKKVVNSFSIKQDGLDFVFTQHYFLNWDSSKSMFCNVCVLNVKGTSLKIFSFERFGWVVLGVHLVSMLSCNIFSYKGVMSVCCAQFPSAGRRVTGPRNLFLVRYAGVADSFCANPGTQGSSAQDLALLFFSASMASVRVYEQDCATHPSIVWRL